MFIVFVEGEVSVSKIAVPDDIHLLRITYKPIYKHIGFFHDFVSIVLAGLIFPTITFNSGYLFFSFATVFFNFSTTVSASWLSQSLQPTEMRKYLSFVYLTSLSINVLTCSKV